MAVLRFLLAWIGLVALLVFFRPPASDPTPWVDAAWSFRAGAFVALPPLWPLLVLSVAFLANTGVPDAAVWVSVVAAAGVPPIAAALARRLEVSRAAALAVGLTAGAAVAPFAYQATPHALFAFVLLLVVATGLEWESCPDDAARMALWLLCAAVAACTHEVGLLVLWVAALGCAGRSFPRAAGEIAVATAGIGLFTMVAARLPDLPPRLAEPLGASPWTAGRWDGLPAFFERFASVSHAAGAVALVGAIGAALAWSWARNKRHRGEPTRPHPWALLSAMSPALAGIVVWTHPADLLVVVPAAAIGIGVAVAALGDWRPRLTVPAHALLAGGLLATAAPAWWTAAHRPAAVATTAPAPRQPSVAEFQALLAQPTRARAAQEPPSDPVVETPGSGAVAEP